TRASPTKQSGEIRRAAAVGILKLIPRRVSLPYCMNGALRDFYARPIRDLRVSLSDRCNFRCSYCLQHGEPPIAPKEQMLSYEEIEYVCDIFVELGIEKIRLTGGEPMMRQDIEIIISKLAKFKSKGLIDLALTTNGYFLPDRADGLKAAGLDRIT